MNIPNSANPAASSEKAAAGRFRDPSLTASPQIKPVSAAAYGIGFIPATDASVIQIAPDKIAAPNPKPKHRSAPLDSGRIGSTCFHVRASTLSVGGGTDDCVCVCAIGAAVK